MSIDATDGPCACGVRRWPGQNPIYPERARSIVTAEQVARLAAAGLQIVESAEVTTADHVEAIRELQARLDATSRFARRLDVDLGIARDDAACAKQERDDAHEQLARTRSELDALRRETARMERGRDAARDVTRGLELDVHQLEVRWKALCEHIGTPPESTYDKVVEALRAGADTETRRWVARVKELERRIAIVREAIDGHGEGIGDGA